MIVLSKIDIVRGLAQEDDERDKKGHYCHNSDPHLRGTREGITATVQPPIK